MLPMQAFPLRAAEQLWQPRKEGPCSSDGQTSSHGWSTCLPGLLVGPSPVAGQQNAFLVLVVGGPLSTARASAFLGSWEHLVPIQQSQAEILQATEQRPWLSHLQHRVWYYGKRSITFPVDMHEDTHLDWRGMESHLWCHAAGTTSPHVRSMCIQVGISPSAPSVYKQVQPTCASGTGKKGTKTDEPETLSSNSISHSSFIAQLLK